MKAKKDKASLASAFAQRLLALRKQRKLTMKQLADQLQVSESFISRLESGERQPSKEFIISLGNILFPEGNDTLLDELLIAADFTPLHLDTFTGSRQDIVRIYEQALEKNPLNFRAYISLILSLIKMGRYPQAQAKIQQGLSLFDDSVQLQALLSTLELAKGHFEKAVQYQEDAIRAWKSHVEPPVDVTLADLLMNLGIIYFIQGYEAIDTYLTAQEEQRTQAAEQANKQAMTTLQVAKQHMQEAVEQAPEDIYILDELARINFNLAYLKGQVEPELYTETIGSFRKIVYSADKHKLSYHDLIESAVFLAHSQAKSGQFDQAEHDINLIECCLPNFWLVPYVKACFYSLKYETVKEEALLEQALHCLRLATAIQDENNRSRQEALKDPDLRALRTQRNRLFHEIIKPEGSRT